MADAPDTLDALRRDLGRALDLMAAKADGYERGREYYDGTRAEVFASKTVRKILTGTAETTPISLAHIPVDVIADKVELAALTADGTAGEVLVKVVDENDLEDEADDYIRKACYFGDYYAIVDPTQETEAGAIVPEGIRVIGTSPLRAIMVYDHDDRTQLYGVKVWRDGKRWRSLSFYNDCTVKLVTDEGSNEWPKPERFEADVDFLAGESEADRDHYIEHEGGRILLTHLAIDGKPYGTPVHAKAYGPQDAITKISATNLNNVDGQGFASRWALADPLAEIDDDIDDDFGDAGPTGPGETPSDGVTTATTGRSRMRTVPGAINILRGIKAVGQFDATPTEHFLKNLDWYVRVMAVATGVALFEFDLTGEQPSGESRRRAEGRSNKKAAKVKRQAAAFFTAIGDTVLSLLGIEDAKVEATFNPSETSTDLDGLELVSAKIKAGVPVAQALLEAGYTDEQVGEWYPEDAPHVTPELLTILAAALQQLGQAKTLGAITDEELRGMLPDILTAARGEGPSVTAIAPAPSAAARAAALRAGGAA